MKYVNKPKQNAMTLLEMLISIGMLTMISVYTAGMFKGTVDTRSSLDQINNSSRKLHIAMNHIVSDVQHAFLFTDEQSVGKKRANKGAFIVVEDGSFMKANMLVNNRNRLFAGEHTSDIGEVGYYVQTESELGHKQVLYRRDSPIVDNSPDRGGMVFELLDDVAEFKMTFNNAKSKDFDKKDWDSTRSDQKDQLPKAVEIFLSMYTQPESAEGSEVRQTVSLRTKVIIEVSGRQ